MPELFHHAVVYKSSIKTDHLGVILPPARKLKPIRTKVAFRDQREHRRRDFEIKIQTCDWKHVTESTNIDEAVTRLNTTIIELMNECLPVRTVTMSSRDPPWMSPLVKYLLKKKNKASPMF